jgi:hypothetical protein
MLRIMVAGVAAVAVGALGGLTLSPQASVESAHSIVTIDTTSTSAPPVLVPSSAPEAIEQTRTAPLPISSELPLPIHEVTSADEPAEHARGHKRRHRSTPRSAPAEVVHRRKGYGSADDDGDDD